MYSKAYRAGCHTGNARNVYSRSFGTHLARGTNCPEFSTFPPCKFRNSISIMPWPLPSKQFPLIIHQSFFQCYLAWHTDNIVTWFCDYWRSFRLDIGFIDHWYTRHVSTITWKSLTPQHMLGIFQPAMSSPAIPWQRFLTMEILRLYTLKCSLHRTELSTDLALTLSLAYNISAQTM
jgi:hypothetical protein